MDGIRMSRRARYVLYAALICLALTLVFVRAGRSDALFVTFSSNPQTATAVADYLPPKLNAATIIKSAGGDSGYVKQNGAYFVYGSVTDQGNPPVGISTVTSDSSSLTTGATASSLTAGNYTNIDGNTYNYKSASLVVGNPKAAGSYAYSFTMKDTLNQSQTTPAPANVIVDNTVPTGSNLSATNGGGTAGRVDAGDIVTWTYSEVMDKQALLAGWDGSATAARLVVTNGGGFGKDTYTVQNSAGTLTLPLGVVTTGNNLTSNLLTYNATMVRSGAVITVTVGTYISGNIATDTAKATMIWNPNASATDRAGNACSLAIVIESPTNQTIF
jgi:hypothetical protein